MQQSQPRSNWATDPNDSRINRASCAGLRLILTQLLDGKGRVYYHLSIETTNPVIHSEKLRAADLNEAKLIAEDQVHYLNTVKNLDWFVTAISQWTELAEQVANKENATQGEIEISLERLVRAEALEAALEVNGPGQAAYERIETCRRKLKEKRRSSVSYK
ncbi:MAG: hypothetical protein HS103_06345 [Anaerolineales bacterium]|nr:hypothetical protein [Anaerolineales bacterium]